MIRLTKKPEPEILLKNAVAWTAELLAAGDKAKVKASRYGHNEVKAALIEETNGKCAYCESKLLHVAYGDVEHIVAKAVDPNRAYDWSNLTLACDRCNTQKGDKEGLIDPYNQTPELYLSFAGPWLAPIVGNDIGKFTVIVLKLNRTPLLERRVERLNSLRDQLDAILAITSVPRRDILLRALIEEVTDQNSEFSACLNQEVRALQAAGHLP